jgi:hypothetical protein
VGSACEGVIKMEGEGIPGIVERGGGLICSLEGWLEDLSYSELQVHISPEKSGPDDNR